MLAFVTAVVTEATVGGWPTLGRPIRTWVAQRWGRSDTWREAQPGRSLLILGGLPFAFFLQRVGYSFASLQSIHYVNANQGALAGGIKRKAAPGPVLWQFHQAFVHGIRVHVMEFFFHLLAR